MARIVETHRRARIESTLAAVARAHRLQFRGVGHAGDVEAGVDVVDFAGDARRQVAQEIESGAADMGEFDRFLQGRMLLVPVVNEPCAADAGTRQRSHGAGRDRVDADAVAAQIGRQIAHRGFQGGFGDTHDVVAGHDAHGACIGQCDHGAALFHQGRGSACNVGEGIAGDFHRTTEVGAGRIDIAALQLIAIGKGDGVDDEVEAAPLPLELAENGFERLIVLDVGFQNNLGTYSFNERLHALAEGIALIGEGQFGAMLVQRLCYAPSNRMIIGNAHNEAAFASHKFHRCRHVLLVPLKDEGGVGAAETE